MAKKEKKEKKEKPLEKMTTKELKEIALTIPGLVGVHGMNKEELIAEIKEHRGITDERKEKKIDTRAIKKKIGQLKLAKTQTRQAGEKDKTDILRRKISRLKKKTRRAA
ncbi:MAG: transcription termination factor Rho [Thermodesulfobacteriota bacterium]